MDTPPLYDGRNHTTPAIVIQDNGDDHGGAGYYSPWYPHRFFDADTGGLELPGEGQIEATTHRQLSRGTSRRSFGSITSFMSSATQGSRTWSPGTSSLSSWSSWSSFVESYASTSCLEPDPEDSNPFSLSAEDLAKLIEDRDLGQLRSYGGVGGIANNLLASCDSGLDSSSDGSLQRQNGPCKPCTYTKRRAIFGTNRLPEKKRKSILGHAIDALKDVTTVILLVVQVITLVVRIFDGMLWFDMVPSIFGLALVLSSNIVISYRIERVFASLSVQKEDRSVWVTRSGCQTSVSVYDVMVGDILMLKPGDRVPADGILISGRNIRCDESCNTGESRPIAKIEASEALELPAQHGDPFIVSGSKIVAGGVGTFLVTCVGVNSTHGRLMLAMPAKTEKTPLQERLTAIGTMIGSAAVTVAVLLFVSLLTKAKMEAPVAAESTSDWLHGTWSTTLLRIVELATAIIFVAVPEGLPMAVSITLFFAQTGMKRDRNLVNKLSSCETMGNATTVCCDKTGTLTTNEMAVTAGMIGTAGQFLNTGTLEVSSEVCEILLKSTVVNSSAFVGYKDGKSEYIGSSTETALVRMAEQCFGLNMPPQEQRKKTKIVETFCFDSTRKCMATVTKISDDLYRMYVKGAPEIVLEKSGRTIEHPSQSTDVPMTKEGHDIFMGAITSYASGSLRTLGLAYRDFSAWPMPDFEPSETSEAIEAKETPDPERLFQQAFQGLTFLGVLGIQDPIRPGVKDAVKRCQGAGVAVRMVTGDNVNTAKAVATECGILDEGGLVLEGPEFRQLSDDQLSKMLPRLQVLARCSPEDKKRIVEKLKALFGETVAVTGDGTNDGPALRAADVGFAMNVSGTEVAKEASSIVLLDDDFASLVKAIAWGRAVIDGIRRFLQFQLTANISTVSVACVSALSSGSQQSILTTAQLLWVNLIMDVGAALALATDGPGADVMDRRPERRTAPLIYVTSWKMIVGQASYQLLVCLYINFYGRGSLGYPPANHHSITRDSFEALFFNMFIWMQFFNLINCRRVDNKLNVFEGAPQNKVFIAIALIIITCQLSFILFGGQWLSISEWALSVGLGFVSLPLGMAIRCIPDELLERFGERIATESRPVMMRATPYISTAGQRVRDELSLQRLQRTGRWIVSIIQAIDIRDTESMPDERTALLETEDMV